MVYSRILRLILAAGLSSATIAQADDSSKALLLYDFEQQGTALGWTATSQMTAEAAPGPAAQRGEGDLPAGRALRIASPIAGRLTGPPMTVPSDWLGFQQIDFWVYRTTEESRRTPTLVFDFVIAEQDGIAHFWRRVDIKGAGWQRQSLPLKWFRQGPGRVARWDRIHRVELRFRGPTNIWIDSVSLLPGKADRAAEFSTDDLREVAFPNAPKETVRSLTTDRVSILTDVRELELEKLADHLGSVCDAVLTDLPFLEKPPTVPPLIVFSSREKYQAFSPALAQRMNSAASPPQAQGFTIMGVATSSWDPSQGSLRPVFAHEYVHALLERTARLGNKTEWFQEGFANYYQLKFHPQRNFADMVRQGVADRSMHMPLRELLSGETIPGTRYWQAVTVVDTLLSHKEYRTRLGPLMVAFQRNGSTNLAPHLKEVLRTDWEGLEKAWRQHCQEAYPVTSSTPRKR